jgi:hypothetical protein
MIIFNTLMSRRVSAILSICLMKMLVDFHLKICLLFLLTPDCGTGIGASLISRRQHEHSSSLRLAAQRLTPFALYLLGLDTMDQARVISASSSTETTQSICVDHMSQSSTVFYWICEQ